MLTNLVVILTIIGNYLIYWIIGRVTGGLKKSCLIRSMIIIGLFVFNSIMNIGGVNNLLYAYRHISGFAGGQVVSLAGMLWISWLGSKRPFQFKKK